MKKILGILFGSLFLVPAFALAAASTSGHLGNLPGRMHYQNSSTANPAIMGQEIKHNTVSPTYVSGTVSAVSGESITLNASSTTYTVDATSAKIYRKFGATMQVTDIQTGDTLQVRGTVNGTSVTATTIRDLSQQQQNASFSGSVTAVNGSNFTLLTKNRGSQTINTTSSTTFKENGITSASISNVTVGENVETYGVWDSTNSTVAAAGVTIVVKTETITGALTAINGTSLTVTTSSTSPTVYSVDASNVKKVDRRFGAQTDLTALQVGDTLQIRGVVNGSSVIASTVRDMSLQARYGTFVGSVTSISGSSFALQSKDRGSQTINTTSTTIFKQGSQTATISNLAVGQTVTVSGVWDRTNSNVTANRVTIKVSSLGITGVLQSISGTTLTVLSNSTTSTPGTTYTVDASKSTFYYKGYKKGDITILQTNDQVNVRGQMISGTSSITASYVRDLSQTYKTPVSTSNTSTTTGQ